MEFKNIQDTKQVANPVDAVPSAAKPTLNFDDELGDLNPTVIKIIGCGGGGSSAVQRMIEDDVFGVQFVVLNTDKQALHKSSAPVRVPIGQKITGGLGAGGNPKVGEDAANEDTERIKLILEGANMVIITAGMGGGTGTGSAPVVAKLAHEAGILTIAVVTTPFEHEGTVRMANALDGLKKLRGNVDSLIVLPNDLIFKAVKSAGTRLTFKEQFKLADNLLCAGVKGVTDLLTRPGDVNLDFADVSSIMRGSGDSILGVGRGKGENRINEAVEGAIANPLLENRQIDGAKKILINITSNGNLTLEETQEISNLVRHSANKNANIILGLATDESMDDEDIAVTVIATDFDTEEEFVAEIQEEKENADEGTMTLDEFKQLTGIKKTLTSSSPSLAPEVPSGRSTAMPKNSLFDLDIDSMGDFVSPAKSSVPEVLSKSEETRHEEEPAAPVEPAAKKPAFTGRGFSDPSKVDLNDENVPAYLRRRARDLSNLPRSIDLTK